MKRRIIMLTTAMSLLAVLGFAQSGTQTVGGTTFGLRAGVNFQNINGKNGNGDKLENKLKTGFNIGANAEVPIAPDFYVQPGVLFSTKGTKFAGSGDTK